jgi:hypothetical protein
MSHLTMKAQYIMANQYVFNEIHSIIISNVYEGK